MSSWKRYQPSSTPKKPQVPSAVNNPKNLRPADPNQPYIDIFPSSYKISKSNMSVNIVDKTVRLIIDFDIEPVFTYRPTQTQPITVNHDISIVAPIAPIVEPPIVEPVVPIVEPVVPIVEPVVPIVEPVVPIASIVEPIVTPIAEPIIEQILDASTHIMQQIANRVTTVQQQEQQQQQPQPQQQQQQPQQFQQVQYVGRPNSVVGIYSNTNTGIVSVIRSPKLAKPYH